MKTSGLAQDRSRLCAGGHHGLTPSIVRPRTAWINHHRCGGGGGCDSVPWRSGRAVWFRRTASAAGCCQAGGEGYCRMYPNFISRHCDSGFGNLMFVDADSKAIDNGGHACTGIDSFRPVRLGCAIDSCCSHASRFTSSSDDCDRAVPGFRMASRLSKTRRNVLIVATLLRAFTVAVGSEQGENS